MSAFTKYFFPSHGDEFGKVVAVEGLKDIPFDIKRVYYMYDTKAGVVRGKHAHKDLEQFLICVSGSCKISFEDGRNEKVFTLEKPEEGLYMPKDIWGEQFDFSEGAVLLVLASELYDESDYIRNYDEFLNLVNSK
ncbi:MAG: WxcM-like domain-containing protein [Selenomonadaceae bacterium]|nr:WxcM-like domain-containing protein [Selenomonadaceae bacterium]